jgi:hypothetical protein
MFKQVVQARIMQVLSDYIEDFDRDFTFNIFGTRGERTKPQP